MTAFNLIVNKIQPSKIDYLIGFITQFMNQAGSYLATRRASKGLFTKWKVFIGRTVWQVSY